jgi:hypothetical protein
MTLWTSIVIENSSAYLGRKTLSVATLCEGVLKVYPVVASWGADRIFGIYEAELQGGLLLPTSEVPIMVGPAGYVHGEMAAALIVAYLRGQGVDVAGSDLGEDEEIYRRHLLQVAPALA